MSNIAVQFDHVGKLYRLGQVGTGSLIHDLNRWWVTRVRGKEDPYLKIGETNDRSKKGESQYVWALRDITFDVEQGDVVGIIGRNGAGKSTLLKLLSSITSPTTGVIRTRGRIGSLLEVGTGFHPEMTGRENIYMNGSIMGMTRQEINRKFDEIVDFAGVERYIDTPVKRYSSGMTVRLGFAVAAFMEPEILVVDEVLAVGDAEFQKKAIGKMQDVSHGEGRTVLFVSHNMSSIRRLCKKGVLLDNGCIKYQGEIDDVVSNYLSDNFKDFTPIAQVSNKHRNGYVGKELEFLEVTIVNEDNTRMATEGELIVRASVKVNIPVIKRFTIGLMINNSEGNRVGTYASPIFNVPQGRDRFNVTITLKNHNLAKGKYSVGLNIGLKELESGLRDYDVIHDVVSFEITDIRKGVPIALWQKQWGNTNYRDAIIKID